MKKECKFGYFKKKFGKMKSKISFIQDNFFSSKNFWKQYLNFCLYI